MKGYSTLPGSVEVEPHYKMQFIVKHRTLQGIQTAYSKPRRLGNRRPWRGLCTVQLLQLQWLRDLVMNITTWSLKRFVALRFWLSFSTAKKLVDYSWGRPEGAFFNSNYTQVQGRELLLSLDCSTLSLIRTLLCWVVSKKVSSTLFWVFGMTLRGIEPRSTGPLVNTLPTSKRASNTPTLSPAER